VPWPGGFWLCQDRAPCPPRGRVQQVLAASYSLPTFPQPREQPLWATPDPRSRSTRGCPVPGFQPPFELGRQTGPGGPLPELKPTPRASHPPRQASVTFSSHRVLHVWDNGPCSLALWEVTSFRPAIVSCPCCPPLTCHVGVGCLGCGIQQPAGEEYLPPPSRGFSSRKRAPAQEPSSSLTGSECACECMQWGMGPRLCPAFPQLCSCPVTVTTVRVAFFNRDFPPLLHPFTKGLGTTSCPFCEIFM